MDMDPGSLLERRRMLHDRVWVYVESRPSPVPPRALVIERESGRYIMIYPRDRCLRAIQVGGGALLDRPRPRLFVGHRVMTRRKQRLQSDQSMATMPRHLGPARRSVSISVLRATRPSVSVPSPDPLPPSQGRAQRHRGNKNTTNRQRTGVCGWADLTNRSRLGD